RTGRPARTARAERTARTSGFTRWAGNSTVGSSVSRLTIVHGRRRAAPSATTHFLPDDAEEDCLPEPPGAWGSPGPRELSGAYEPSGPCELSGPSELSVARERSVAWAPPVEEPGVPLGEPGVGAPLPDAAVAGTSAATRTQVRWSAGTLTV